MEKEIRNWIGRNCPHKLPKVNSPNDIKRYEIISERRYNWINGAIAMAEHITNQPPTKEQIIGVLQYVYNELFPSYNIPPKGFDILVEDILNKWDYED